jgi:uncharacterized protein
MYNLADTTYRFQPPTVSHQTIQSTFRWIVSQIKSKELPGFHVALHGGEPLLAGRELFEFVSNERNKAEQEAGKPISLSVLSNGLLCDEVWAAFLQQHRIRYGFSLDGPAEYHDRHRKTKNGRGTHSIVEKRIHTILNNSQLKEGFSSVLSVIHPGMDGAELIRYFYDLGLPACDVLLPDQNWINGSEYYPPPNRGEYGQVLADAYLEWRRIDDPSFYVRKFGMLIEALLGMTPTLDSLGIGPITVFTVETSGEVEPVDSLKICGNGFTKTGHCISTATVDSIPDLPMIRLGLEKRRTLPNICRKCDHRTLCGGGYLPHRFSKKGFQKPTVYCGDMMFLCDLLRLDVLLLLKQSRKPRFSKSLIDCIDYLKRVGADTAAHSRGYLLQHLVGTASILASWDCSLSTIYGGLFHTIYGSPTYEFNAIVSRREVAKLIGRQAESVAYRYSKGATSEIRKLRINQNRNETIAGVADVALANGFEQWRRNPRKYPVEHLVSNAEIMENASEKALKGFFNSYENR